MSEAAVAAPVAAPAAAPVAAPVAAPAAAPAAPQWFDNFTDPNIKGWVQAAGVPTPEAAAAKAYNLEKLLGADRAGRTVVLPKDAGDTAGWDEYYNKTGRPSSPDGYKLAVDGAHPDFAKAAAAEFHAAGLSEAQAGRLAKWYGEAGKQAAEAAAVADEAKLRAEHQQLDVDWGTGNAALIQKEIARRAAAKLGLDETAIGSLEKVVGFSKVMKAFAKMGELMGEAKFEAGDAGGSFGQTPEAARARKSQLMADPTWRAAAMNPASKEWAELQKLDTVIAASMPAAWAA